MVVVAPIVVGALGSVCKNIENSHSTNKDCNNWGALAKSSTSWNSSNSPEGARKIRGVTLVY